MALYIGANYHPHDWPSGRWPVDIQLMKNAGFNMVRLGHLCWDSYEPDNGVYTFDWFDTVMNLFAEAGIKVIVDVAAHPAPRWVHRLCPGCNVCGPEGNPQDSITRYMEDVDDPDYQMYALRFAKTIVSRYNQHPALFAFALDNELGSGFPSYSSFARSRFQSWLENKYGTVEKLNRAWQTQRWSRRLNSFDDVVLQENSLARGEPAAWLDMRRFYSDGIAGFIMKLSDVVKANAPLVPQTANHYPESGFGFDYLKYCYKNDANPGIASYPEYMPGNNERLRGSTFYHVHRLAEIEKPIWILEFQTGTGWNPQGPYGVNRMHIFMYLLYRSQMVLGWTWRTMLAGEEQFLYGLLSHDGQPTQNYREYQQTASDLKKLEQYAFPYIPKAEVGVAYNYENKMAAIRQAQQFNNKDYTDVVREALVYLDENNIDYNIVDIRNLRQNYKLLIVPGYYLMEPAASDTIRSFVQRGGTVIMTGFSGMLDEYNTVFSVPRPGALHDVFGIRVATFERTNVPWKDNTKIEILINGAVITSKSTYYEVLELNTASCFAKFPGCDFCAVSENRYGNGRAYYAALDSDAVVFDALIPCIAEIIDLTPPLKVPKGVRARKIADGQYFYVNTLAVPVKIQLPENGTGVLTGKKYVGALNLAPFDAELIVL
jgi:beta-galactosidase